jgi:hypothetical protein
VVCVLLGPRLPLVQEVIDVRGSNKRFPLVKDRFVRDATDLTRRNVLDGDAFLAGPSNSWRFASPETEPYMRSQRPGLPWFSVRKVTREEYQAMKERRKAAQAAAAEAAAAGELPEGSGSEEGQEQRPSPKERMDANW